jgi:transitional endoplasmic reticulum ATPase
VDREAIKTQDVVRQREARLKINGLLDESSKISGHGVDESSTKKDEVMSDANKAVIDALTELLEGNPDNAMLWLHLADLHEQAGDLKASANALRKGIDHHADLVTATLHLSRILRRTNDLAEAMIRVEDALAKGEHARLRLELANILYQRGAIQEAGEQYQRSKLLDPSVQDDVLESLAVTIPSSSMPDSKTLSDPQKSPQQPTGMINDRVTVDETVAQFQDDGERVTFQDVVGLDHVKTQIQLRVLAPMQQNEIFKAFRKTGGGGLLLYGPPGCGKTFLARATAGEIGARFMIVGIHDVVDKYWGESEKAVHAIFEYARRRSPTVLFFDEFDALGSSRGRTDSHFWVVLIDQLLQEMDGIKGRNRDLLVFAATNLPWNVDSAFRRPGRFDRTMFVPPPDEPARAEILRRYIGELPGAPNISAEVIAKKTNLFSGADLRSLCERASEKALTRSLKGNRIHPVSQQDFLDELRTMRSSTHEWLTNSRSYVRYANEAGQYDELADFLKQNRLF